MSNVLSAAIEYVSRGFSVFPCDPQGKEPLKQGKYRLQWGRYRRQIAGELTVRDWFTKHPDRNLGIVTGDVSDNLVVRDFDLASAYQSWRVRHSELAAALPTVRSGRDGGGFHVYGRMTSCPTGFVFKDGSGEVKGNGNYVIAPPSRHPSGSYYVWIVPLGNEIPIVKPADFDLSDSEVQARTLHRGTQTDTEVRRQRRRTQEEHRTTQAITRGPIDEKLLADAIVATIPTHPGQRDHKLFELARRLLGIGGEGIPLDQLLNIFARWWDRAKTVVATQDKPLSLHAFLRAYERAEIPFGDTVARLRDVVGSTEPPAWAVEIGLPLLGSLCRELQRLNGDKPFPLSCRVAEKVTGVSHTTEAKNLALLVNVQKLALIEKGTQGSSGLATTYRYIADDL